MVLGKESDGGQRVLPVLAAARLGDGGYVPDGALGLDNLKNNDYLQRISRP